MSFYHLHGLHAFLLHRLIQAGSCFSAKAEILYIALIEGSPLSLAGVFETNDTCFLFHLFHLYRMKHASVVKGDSFDRLTTDGITPILIKGVAVNFRDKECGNPIAVGNLIQPALSCFQFEGYGFHLNALVPT